MKIKNLIVIIAVSVLSSLSTYYLLYKDKAEKKVGTFQNTEPNYRTKSVAMYSDGVTNFTTAAAISTPAVVHVASSYTHNTSKSREFYGEDVYEWFFGHSKPQGFQRTPPKQQLGAGSGVIISEDGFLVTNNHVIENANDIEITLSNNRKYKAILIGKDKDTDLAVLKIEEKALPFLKFANSDDVKIGEWVLAVGNPFDLSSTVTAGIVSAKGRNINILKNHSKNRRGNTAIESFIQTDAAVNPGNSGGALVNTKGELIGINTAIATPTGTFAGYSFAVPANLVFKVVEDIIDFGEAQRGFLGVNIANVNDKMAHELQLNQMEGIFIANIQEGGAAWNAGLEINDVIISIDNENVKSTAELQEKIAEYRPGDIVKVIFIREGKQKKLNVKLQ